MEMKMFIDRHHSHHLFFAAYDWKSVEGDNTFAEKRVIFSKLEKGQYI